MLTNLAIETQHTWMRLIYFQCLGT